MKRLAALVLAAAFALVPRPAGAIFDPGSQGHVWDGYLGGSPVTAVSGDLRAPSWEPGGWYYDYLMVTGGTGQNPWWVQIGYEPFHSAPAGPVVWVEAVVLGPGGWQQDRAFARVGLGSWHHFDVYYAGADWWAVASDGVMLATFNMPGTWGLSETAFETAPPFPAIPDMGFANLNVGQWCSVLQNPGPYHLIDAVPCSGFYVRSGVQ